MINIIGPVILVTVSFGWIGWNIYRALTANEHERVLREQVIEANLKEVSVMSDDAFEAGNHKDIMTIHEAGHIVVALKYASIIGKPVSVTLSKNSGNVGYQYYDGFPTEKTMWAVAARSLAGSIAEYEILNIKTIGSSTGDMRIIYQILRQLANPCCNVGEHVISRSDGQMEVMINKLYADLHQEVLTCVRENKDVIIAVADLLKEKYDDDEVTIEGSEFERIIEKIESLQGDFKL